jgi:hypothetical protein
VTVALVVHQALYGYDDGHRLLAASRSLPSEDRRWLLRQTDSPDAGTGSIWTELLAGYPLPSGRYAWAMTWPAPEVPRPGCVWTHVLIFEPEDLRSDRALPLAAFARPFDLESARGRYREPVELPSSPANGALEPILGSALTTVLWAFYEPPSVPVRIGRVHLPDGARHILLTAPWRVAWPELRQRLSFADAPNTPRQLPDGPYDLLLQSTARKRAADDERVIDGVLPTKPPRWVEDLAADTATAGGLRDFIAEFGPLLVPERESMVPVVQCWRWLSNTGTESDAEMSRLLAAVSRISVRSSDPLAVVQRLLDTVVAPAGCERPVDVVALLRGLVASSEATSLLDAVDVARLTKLVLAERPEELHHVLSAVRSPLSEAGDRFLNQLTVGLEGKALKAWLVADPAGVVALLRLRPTFAQNPEIWQALKPDDAWEALRRVRGKKQRVEVITSIAEAGLSLDVDRVATEWKDVVPLVAARLLSDNVTDERLWPWLDSLTLSEKRELLSNANGAVDLAEAVIRRLEPHQIARWPLVDLRAVTAHTRDPLVQAKLFLAALANVTKPTWAEVAVGVYGSLYESAVAEGGVRLGAARELLAELERDSRPDWDVGARLARALNRALKNGRWPAAAALGCRNESAFRALLESDDRAGLARRILEALLKEPIAMEDWQRSALFETTTQNADRDALADLLARFESVAGITWRALRRW